MRPRPPRTRHSAESRNPRAAIGLLAIALLLLGAAPTLAAEPPHLERAHDPIEEIDFRPVADAMEPRYLRQLELKVGDRAFTSDLNQAAQRLNALPFIDQATVSQEGPVLHVDLAEKPVLYAVPVPLPIISQLGIMTGLEEWHLAQHYWLAHAQLFYFWDHFRVYDPTNLTPVKQADHVDDYVWGNFDFGTQVAPDWRLVLTGEDYLSTLGDLTGTYAPVAQANGNTFMMGPELRYDNADDPAFPRLGTRFRIGTYFGSSLFGNPNDFTIYRGEIQRYIPISRTECLLASLTGGIGRGVVPWHEKFQAGGNVSCAGMPISGFWAIASSRAPWSTGGSSTAGRACWTPRGRGSPGACSSTSVAPGSRPSARLSCKTCGRPPGATSPSPGVAPTSAGSKRESALKGR